MVNTRAYKIACYVRVSTEEQAKNPEGSIKNQQERIKQAVRFKNMQGDFGEIVDFYIDRGKSGKDTNRPELQRLLADIQDGKITLVAVSELSRISRNIKDFSEIWEMMKDLGCGFYSLRENFDSTTAAGEMVLFSMANLAQFERRQISERITANLNSRASRGLYNGGPIPLGYKLIEGKTGYLAVDEKAAETVRACFKAFLLEGTLSLAARWLNENGYSPKSKIEGGGGKSRQSAFSIENLYRILTNRSYLGKRTCREDGKVKEVQAVWKPIVDEDGFHRVGEILKKNKCRKKTPAKNRYPYLLSGLVYCLDCGDVLCGKSAHGNGGKIGYYEHGWSVRKSSCLTKKVFDCGSFKRIGAKKLEPVVLGKIRELIQDTALVQKLLEKTRAIHEQNPKQREIERLNGKLQGLDRQLVALAERLSELPSGISASPIYKLMARVEEEKGHVEKLLEELRAQGCRSKREIPELGDFQGFLKAVSRFLADDTEEKVRVKAIATLVHRIEVSKEKLNIHYYIGTQDTKKGLPHQGSPALFLANPKNSLGNGSSTLTKNGE